MTSPLFQLDCLVRDYECDQQGIVNNANYLHYFEHARHEYLHRHGVIFDVLAKQGVYLVLLRAEIDYVLALKSRDRFMVSVHSKKISRLKCAFDQQITLVGSNKCCAKGHFTATAINAAGKPIPIQALGCDFLND